MSRSRDGFRTRDLTLASFLALQGHDYSLEREGESPRGHPIGVWVFTSDDTLDGDVDAYQKHVARVEPAQFMRRLTTQRRELYDYLGVSRGGR